MSHLKCKGKPACPRGKRVPLLRMAMPLAFGLSATVASPAGAVSFNIGAIEGQLDSSLSLESDWATASPAQHLIGANNGGKGYSQASDDGRLNFKRGETFSKVFRGVHGLEFRYGDTGLYLKGRYWYDFELKDEGRPFKDISDSNRKDSARASGAELLDAYVWHNFALGDLPGTVRVGRQVLNWGEGTFIGNGINTVNPIDVSAFRRPGTQISDGLAPTNLFYLQQNITSDLSAEGFYQIKWDQTSLDNCGTFFSQSDVMADGCSGNLAVSQTRNGFDASLADAGLSGAQRSAVLGSLASQGVAFGNPDEGAIVRRGADRDAHDGGQFGVALRYNYAPLGTEFGAYFMNYHSRLPIFSGRGAGAGAYSSAALIGSLTGAGVPASIAASLAPSLQPAVAAGDASYFIEYPENIQLYGLSFATTLASGTEWKGEVSYRPNAPVQINAADLLYSTLTDAASADQDVSGYRRKEITQWQTTLTHYFDQVMGADRFTLTGELGWTHVGGLESTSRLRYGRDPVYGPGSAAACQAAGSGCDSDGFTTADSWGYRAKGVWEFYNVLPRVTLKPSLAWAHDVDGYSPAPGGNFEEGRKAISLGLDAEYQSTYTASLYYTNFFDGKYSTVDDRDFVAMSVGIIF